LENDGVVIHKNIFLNSEIDDYKKKSNENNYKDIKTTIINHPRLNKLIKETIGKDYIFQDYIRIIKKSSVHTCHRDNNGTFFNKGQHYSSYTILIYLEDMEKCLGVIPNSHKNINSFNINLQNNIENILCNKGDIIIFNANIIHVGAINKKNNNLRIQMKITHKDDIDKISYYQNYNKILNKKNKLPKFLIKAQKNLSCMFPIISNLTQNENIKTARGSDNGANIGIFQKIFSYLFYGNANFYDLPNAF